MSVSLLEGVRMWVYLCIFICAIDVIEYQYMTIVQIRLVYCEYNIGWSSTNTLKKGSLQ